MVEQQQTKGRVLFISSQPFFEWRGSPIRVSFNMRALTENGYDVDLLTMPIGADQQIPGMNVIRVPNVFGLKTMSIGPSLWKAIYDIFILFKAFSLSRRNTYDVIHGIEDGGFIAALVAKRRKTKLVFEKHSDPQSYKEGVLRNVVMWLYAKAESFAIRRADAVIGTGPGLIEQAKALEPRASLHVISDIPSSLVESSEDGVTAWRSKIQKNEDDVLIGYVGSFAVYQGIDLMFDAIPLVVAECKQARFVIVGGTPEEIAERKAALATQNAADAVVFLGKIPPDELPDVLASTDVLLSPRIAGKNTPLKLLDYLKAGAAIVGCDNEANRLILDDENSLLVAPESGAFAQGIVALAKDEGRRRQLSGSGRKLIDEKYNFRVFRDGLKACYEGL